VNPWGILFTGLGLIMIIVGFKGSQHNVIAAFKGAAGNLASGTSGQARTASTPGNAAPVPANGPNGRLTNT
jgi:hypothetical protein